MTLRSFSDLDSDVPDPAAILAENQAHASAFRSAPTAAAQEAVLQSWDVDLRRFQTARAVVSTRYDLDTRAETAKRRKETWDDQAPAFAEAQVAFLREVVGSPWRRELEGKYGEQLFRCWDLEIASFDPVLAEDKRAESRLERRYTELMASIRIPFRGESLSLTELGRYGSDPDRSVRLAAQRARFAALAEHRAELDALYDNLVATRDAMARKLGDPGYIPLAYRERFRDFTPDEAAAFRRQVKDVLVPLASRLRARHAAALGLSDYAFHDTTVDDPRGAPLPKGDAAWVLDRAGVLFRELGSDFASLWATLRERGLLDVLARDGKAGGGFCTALTEHGLPFVFANFVGTHADVDVLTHECGHAYQAWRSMASLSMSSQTWATSDAAEIHSMGLELLAHPHAELFFGEDADRYRRFHLERCLLFIPYGVAVDEFQHVVFANPDMSPDDRAEAWRELERTYLPEWRFDGMPHAESGRFWQVQRHIYLSPFYYLDYCLAQTCALQLWQRARTDRAGAMNAYRHLAKLGGSLPFSGLVREAGLESPFAAGCLTRMASDLEAALGA